MKFIIQTILAIGFLIFAISLHAQTPNEKPLVMPPDSIAIVSLKDYNTFFIWLQDNATKSQYDKLNPETVLLEFQRWAIREWNKKKKPK